MCVAAVQDEVVGLGGQGRPVEIGVISLGTTTADGQKREVRVEVLGVLDRQNRRLRLRATEPVQGATQVIQTILIGLAWLILDWLTQKI